jgi:hypothetical protein
MLPLILVAVGAYLIGDSVLEDKKYAKGGKTQGYDDKEDERLAMEHGKMSKKDLDSTHARRDDARFEERGKMEHGGMAGTHKYTIAEAKKMLDAEKSKNEGFSWFVPDLDYEGDDYDQEYGVHLSDKGLLDLANEIYKKGGKMAKGGKTKSKFFKGQSIIIEKITTPSLIKALPKWNDYAGKELVIEEIEFDKPYKKVTKSFVRETGEKVPFSIFLNDSVEQYKKGGKLVGKQKNLDVNKNGKLDAEDFKMLRKGK